MHLRGPTEVYRARRVDRAGAPNDAPYDEIEQESKDNDADKNGEDQYAVKANAISDRVAGEDGFSGEIGFEMAAREDGHNDFLIESKKRSLFSIY
ncbi:hypothetical protein IEQ34_019973 [Dendrobium chrysotoxum]|uniref:Uncharacterized protein n=1 Tax=Dendrobium chrysotoxum TaxID=161865 RepID=A0AAV7GAC2_DENCH|nr:hypothetical protein IEQ34_019973 [Dendrobium chrysotoxum]